MPNPYIVTIIFMLTATQSVAVVPGAGGCGACSFPQEKAQSAALLEQQIQQSDRDHLRRLLLVSELCATNGFDCGNLSEAEAGRLVEYHFESTRSWWDAVQKVVLGIVALAGLTLGLANRYRPRS